MRDASKDGVRYLRADINPAGITLKLFKNRGTKNTPKIAETASITLAPWTGGNCVLAYKIAPPKIVEETKLTPQS
jgi:hypothetical protein